AGRRSGGDPGQAGLRSVLPQAPVVLAGPADPAAHHRDLDRRRRRALMSRPEFTCLLPVYGGDDPGHFREAARSLRDASLRPNEIVICQDGLLPPGLAEAVRDCVLTLG